ncbi:MAG: polyphosphate kinase 2 family protein [Variibacter sp.]|nr:polyphosphate kinase 2 family protein [Variibacter sp.]
MIPQEMVKRFRVTKGKKFRLADFRTDDTCGLDIEKKTAKDMLATGIDRLKALQEKLYAQDRWALLVVLQAMDAAGKDSAIEHVMSGVNPQGCDVHAFKVPSVEELDHDFLWRAARRLPERGRIGLFNRSHYEEVLVVRVHEDILARQRLPQELVTKHIWDERLKDIRNFESYLGRNGIVPIKFFLHVSPQEQRRRFLERLKAPQKRWKFSMGDVAERRLWDRYMDAYEQAIRATATSGAPWYVVPADNKWFARLVIAGAIVYTLEKLDLKFPRVEGEALKELERVRGALLAEEPKANGKKAEGKKANGKKKAGSKAKAPA